MKYDENIHELEALHPDYMGFLFFSGSKRYVESELPEIPKEIHKIGVFVNQEENEVVENRFGRKGSSCGRGFCLHRYVD